VHCESAGWSTWAEVKHGDAFDRCRSQVVELRRSLLLLAAFLVVAGGFVVGLLATPSGGHPRIASPPGRMGVVTGELRYQAGLDNTWHPMHGDVIFRPARVSHWTIRVGVPRSGRFRVSLPVGTWFATGQGSMFTVNGMEATCTAVAPLRVTGGPTVTAYLQCIGK
jgi:hypothetical protein